jgi:uncharacterized membrane protein
LERHKTGGATLIIRRVEILRRRMMSESTRVCEICHQVKELDEMLPLDWIRGTVGALLHRQHPDCNLEGFICLDDLSHLRSSYVDDVMATQKGELSALEAQVARSLQEHVIASRDLNSQFDRTLSFGERVSDRVASFGGSWGFILSFVGALIGWIIVNSILLSHPFDPAPFILLNLILSCVAALQAPVIMMSQNRQNNKDRLSAENDYRTNLKAELEIQHLHEKIDFLLLNQMQRLLEIQDVQLELMQEIVAKNGTKTQSNSAQT